MNDTTNEPPALKTFYEVVASLWPSDPNKESPPITLTRQKDAFGYVVMVTDKEGITHRFFVSQKETGGGTLLTALLDTVLRVPK